MKNRLTVFKDLISLFSRREEKKRKEKKAELRKIDFIEKFDQ